MRAVLAAFVLTALVVSGASCTEPRSTLCRQICKREAECIEETGSKIPFEENECVAACAALEQDSANNGAKVQRHADCVTSKNSCAAVLLECK